MLVLFSMIPFTHLAVLATLFETSNSPLCILQNLVEFVPTSRVVQQGGQSIDGCDPEARLHPCKGLHVPFPMMIIDEMSKGLQLLLNMDFGQIYGGMHVFIATSPRDNLDLLPSTPKFASHTVTSIHLLFTPVAPQP